MTTMERLDQEVAEARAAFLATTQDMKDRALATTQEMKDRAVATSQEMKDRAVAALDPQPWARSNPWGAVGAAAVAGLVAGLVAPAATHSVKRSRRVRANHRRAAEWHAEAASGGAWDKIANSGLMDKAFSAVMEMARLAVTGMMAKSAQSAAKSADHASDAAENAADNEASASYASSSASAGNFQSQATVDPHDSFERRVG